MNIDTVSTSLQSYNTFGIDAHAHRFLALQSTEQAEAVLRAHKGPVRVLGGGSNVLVTGDVDELLLQMDIGGIALTGEDDQSVSLRVGGGVVWHDLVLWALARGYGGLENLSLIPGRVGAAPIQNIGAYGVELERVFDRLEALELATGHGRVFTKDECQFGYRYSVFKGEAKGRYLITHVHFKLTKAPYHQLQLEYGAIQKNLQQMGVDRPGIGDVSRAVISIRRSKLPDPAEIGNSGSFFKNPELNPDFFNRLRIRFPDVVSYPMPDGRIKVPAGWLIEQCGWKGKRRGSVGCYHKQALVLVNYGGATGAEVWDLATDIQSSVKEKFGVDLEPEVNVW